LLNKLGRSELKIAQTPTEKPPESTNPVNWEVSSIDSRERLKNQKRELKQPPQSELSEEDKKHISDDTNAWIKDFLNSQGL
jgi:hypothetical protein